jgi:hypothetical protein
MEEELKPCPFCSSIPTLRDLAGWEIHCKCGIGMVLAEPDKGPLIAAWNRHSAIAAPAQNGGGQIDLNQAETRVNACSGPVVAAPAQVEWTDQWGCKNTATIEGAANLLKEMFDAWPGWPEEIESSINQWRKRAQAAEAKLAAPPSTAAPVVPEGELEQLRYQNLALVAIYDEVKNLIRVKGRHNNEIAYKRLVAAFDACNS